MAAVDEAARWVDGCCEAAGEAEAAEAAAARAVGEERFGAGADEADFELELLAAVGDATDLTVVGFGDASAAGGGELAGFAGWGDAAGGGGAPPPAGLSAVGCAGLSGCGAAGCGFAGVAAAGGGAPPAGRSCAGLPDD